MAIYPCDATSHRYPQPQQAAYISVVAGADVTTYRLRLCPAHFRAVHAAAMEHLEFVDEDTQSSTVCVHCGDPRESIIFARIFPSKSEELTFAADLCSAHAAEAAKELLLSNQRPLPGR